MKSSQQENSLATNVSSKEKLDYISQQNYQYAAHSRFAKDVDVSYSKGYVKGYSWIDEMCNHYFSLEKNLILEFKVHLEKKLNEIEDLEESRYKDGLKASIHNALKNM